MSEIHYSKLSCQNHFGEETQCCKEIDSLRQRLKEAEEGLRQYQGEAVICTRCQPYFIPKRMAYHQCPEHKAKQRGKGGKA